MSKTQIKPTDNGSIFIQGDFELLDGDGNKYDLKGKDSVWLCRCGHSENKPFCDGHHKTTGFKSEVKAK